MALLEVKNINAGYGKKQVLYDISFEVEQGEIVLLVGSNGSGKSTLLKAIYGLLPLWNNSNSDNSENKKGSVYFNGEKITDLPTSELLKKGLLYIPQKDNLFADLTVKENLEMAGLTIGNRKILQERIEQALDNFPSITPHLKRIPMNLSGGERQLLTLAMAILHKPKMILIDEPFSGLSEQNIVFVKDTFKRLNEKNKVTFLIVEHRITETYRMAQKIVGLKLGKVYSIRNMDSDFIIPDLHNIFI